jgi:hypothetical protein
MDAYCGRLIRWNAFHGVQYSPSTKGRIFSAAILHPQVPTGLSILQQISGRASSITAGMLKM